jgi:vacuolar protein sorting-associated protein 13A/C
VQLTKSIVLASFMEADPGHPPYLIENYTDCDVLFHQKYELSSTRKSQAEYPWHDVRARSTIPYYWDDISLPKPLELVFHVYNSQFSVTLDSIGLDEVARFASGERKSTTSAIAPLRVQIYADGPTKILRIAPVNSDVPALFNSNVEDEKDSPHLEISVWLPKVGVSIVDENPREIAYVFFQDMQLILTKSERFLKTHAQIGRIQVDNTDTSYDSPFPVVFSTPRMEKSQVPFVQLRVFQSLDHPHVLYFKYLGILFQEFDLRLDDRVAESLFNFAFNILNRDLAHDLPIGDVETHYFDEKSEMMDAQSLQNSVKSFIFVEQMEIYKIKGRFSFFTSTKSSQPSNAALSHYKSIKQTLGIVAKNVEEVPLSLPGTRFERPSFTKNMFVLAVLDRYKWHLTSNVLKILGSAQVLGSPVTLFRSVGTGVYEFFAEPMEGFKKGPAQFGFGVLKGGAKLVKHSVYGVGNTIASFTGTVGNALATLSVDDDYIKSREEQHVRERPADFIDVLNCLS